MKKKLISLVLVAEFLSYVFVQRTFAQTDVAATGVKSNAKLQIITNNDSSTQQQLNAEAQQELQAVFPFPSTADMANILGWTPAHNLCGGYYLEPKAITSITNPPDISESTTTITADETAYFSQSGTSTLIGHVTANQPGRQITAHKAILYRDVNTGRLIKIILLGNVNLREAGKLVVGNSAELNLAKGTLIINHNIYHLTQPSPMGTLNAWGTAKRFYREPSGILNFFSGSYTTCPPNRNNWLMRASHIKLNKKTGRGTAYNARLFTKGVPFAYLPYFNFPIDKRRYSGFLYPTLGFTSLGGTDLSIPYYLNLAPNYDATITPRIITKRGDQMSGLFRYLTHGSSGSLLVSYLPNDKAFKNFQQTAIAQYGYSPLTTPFLNRLQNDSDNRGLFSFQDDTWFNDKWSSTVNLNYVTDDYYFQDFGMNPFVNDDDQLLNDADLNYQNEHWRFLASLQGYQTLHLINQAYVLDQYTRLPQLDLSADYPGQKYGLDYQWDSEYINFEHANDFFYGSKFPTGSRLHLDPSVNLPMVAAAGFVTPQLQLDTTGYVLNNNAQVNPAFIGTPQIIVPYSGVGNPNNLNRIIPIFDVDSGLYFERETTLFHHAYKQTLEPRVFYLFVPQENQNLIPIFDTTLPPFSFDELFRTNRFIGYDRIGDANQMSVGVTSRYLDDYTSEDKLDVSIGEIYYIRKHTVCLYPDCSDDPTINDPVSPIAGQLNYHLTPHWSAGANEAWDPNKGDTDNNNVYIQYNPAPRQVVNLSYTFVQNGDVINADPNSSENDLKRIDLNGAWPLTQRWSVVGDWNYNLSHKIPQNYLYGVQYDTCCWAVRFIGGKMLTSEDIYGNTIYSNTYFLQFQLKGLGNIGNSDPGNLLTSIIPGYQDTFRG